MKGSVPVFIEFPEEWSKRLVNKLLGDDVPEEDRATRNVSFILWRKVVPRSESSGTGIEEIVVPFKGGGLNEGPDVRGKGRSDVLGIRPAETREWGVTAVASESGGVGARQEERR